MLFRVMDRQGNWERYALVKKFTEAYEKKIQGWKMDNDPPSPTFADLAEVVYLDGVTTILKRGYTKGAFFENWLSNHTNEEREQILKAAGERGDKLHCMIDWLLTYEQEGEHEKDEVTLDREMEVFNRETKEEERLEDDEWDALLSFSEFWNRHSPVVLRSESPVYNTMFGGYAGTADALLILTRECGTKTCKCKGLVGKIGLFDWKSSSGIRASYDAQLAAYAFAENIGDYLPPAQSVAYAAILRIGTSHKTTGGYEMRVLTRDAETEAQDQAPYKNPTLFFAWKRFLGAKDIGDFETKPFDAEEDIIDVPDELKMIVPKFDFETARADAEALAAQQPKVAKVKQIGFDLSKLRVDAWITTPDNELAKVVELEDSGKVYFFTEAAQHGTCHYTEIKAVFETEIEARGTGEMDATDAAVKIPPADPSKAVQPKFSQDLVDQENPPKQKKRATKKKKS